MIGVHFSDIFQVSSERLEEYGAFNISLLADVPLFIDPFLLFSSAKPEYQTLHKQILDYLTFLKKKADEGVTDKKLIESWYSFPERKQNWLGYCELGNGGKGLGPDFARNMHSIMPEAFKELGNETITATSHLEKVGLFKQGVGKDNISDFTTNLISDFLLKYTEYFALQNIDSTLCKTLSVQKAYFDYQVERWMPKTYTLPYFNDFVILTPKDILTRDETWINQHDMLDQFEEITASIENGQLRAHINNYFRSKIPNDINTKRNADKILKNAQWETIRQYPVLMEYYISKKEKEKDKAKSVADYKVHDIQQVLVSNVQLFFNTSGIDSRFFTISPVASYAETHKRIRYFKDCIENNDGYKIFYIDNKPVKREADLQILFRFVWYGTELDVNREVNNGRGPVDYKISLGAKDATLVEFKLASNSNLKKNLANQLEIYQKANNNQQGIKVIMYFSDGELKKVKKILEELKLEKTPDVILIDARPKKSASLEG